MTQPSAPTPMATADTETSSGPAPDEVVEAFFAVAHAFRRTVDRRFRDSPLSMARLKVLDQLSDAPTRMGELSECIDVAPRTMTSTVKGLERDGLVERHPDPADGRATVVTITDRGRTAYERGWAIRRAALSELVAALDSRERAAFLAVLYKLAAADQAEDERATAAGRAAPVATG